MKPLLPALCLVCLFGFSCRAQQETVPATEQVRPAAQATMPGFTYRLIPAKNNTFGYEILQNGQPFIRQQSIPGETGSRGFSKKVHARKIAELVIRKLNKGEMPPTVTRAELLRLGAIE